MNSRLINILVDGSHLTKDRGTAGVQHEGNSTVLRIKFDETWDNLAKSVTWWNAKGLNPVVRVLTVDMLEDIQTDTRIYRCPIPAEPLTEAGMCTFVIDGFLDGKRQRSVSDQLKVTPAPYAANAGTTADPTPTQAEQLQAQMEAVVANIRRAIEAAGAADTAIATAQAAQLIAAAATAAAEEAAQAAKDAQNAVVSKHASRHAATGDDAITPAMIGAIPVEQQVPDGKDLNTVTFAGIYRLNVTHGNIPTGCEYGQLLVVRGGLDTIAQMCFSLRNEAYVRSGNPPDVGGVGAWSAWRRILFAGDDPSLIGAAQAASVYDIDLIYPTGMYRVAGAGGTFPPGCEAGTGTMFIIYWDANYSDQIYLSYHTFRMYRRRRNGSAWEPWYLMYDDYTFTKSTVDIGEGAAMSPCSWYAVYE